VEKLKEGKPIFRKFSKRLRGTHKGWSPCIENFKVAEGNPKMVSLYLENFSRDWDEWIPIDAYTWKILNRQRGQTHVDAHT
jgi:hypothetical protein